MVRGRVRAGTQIFPIPHLWFLRRLNVFTHLHKWLVSVGFLYTKEGWESLELYLEKYFLMINSWDLYSTTSKVPLSLTGRLLENRKGYRFPCFVWKHKAQKSWFPKVAQWVRAWGNPSALHPGPGLKSFISWHPVAQFLVIFSLREEVTLNDSTKCYRMALHALSSVFQDGGQCSPLLSCIFVRST